MKHAKSWSLLSEFVDRFSPKLLPGKHRYCALLDYRPSPVITNPAAFTTWAARHAGATK